MRVMAEARVIDKNPVIVHCSECVRRNTIYCPMRKDEVRYPIRDDGFCCYGTQKKDGTEYGT